MASIPTFSRIEIRSGGKQTIQNAAQAIRALSHAMDKIIEGADTDETAAILTHHAIKATSSQLRKEG